MRVVYRLVQVDGDPSERVHNLLETGELHADVVMDVDAQQVLDGVDSTRGPGERMRRIDLLGPVAGNLDHGVPGYRYHNSFLVPLLEADEQHDVAAGIAALAFYTSGVTSQDQRVHALVRVRREPSKGVLHLGPFFARNV